LADKHFTLKFWWITKKRQEKYDFKRSRYIL